MWYWRKVEKFSYTGPVKNGEVKKEHPVWNKIGKW
jgi:hypothetical protein